MLTNIKKLINVTLLSLVASNIALANYNYNYNVNDNYTKIYDVSADRANQIKLLELNQKTTVNELNNKILLDYLYGCPLNDVLLGKSGLITDSNLKYVNIKDLKNILNELNQSNANSKVTLFEQACTDLYNKRQQIKIVKQKDLLLESYQAPYLSYKFGYVYNTKTDYVSISYTKLELGFRLDKDYTASAYPTYFNFSLDNLMIVRNSFEDSSSLAFDFGVGLRKDFGILETRHPFISAQVNAEVFTSELYTHAFGGSFAIGYDFGNFEIDFKYEPQVVYSQKLIGKSKQQFSNGFGLYFGIIGTL